MARRLPACPAIPALADKRDKLGKHDKLDKHDYSEETSNFARAQAGSMTSSASPPRISAIVLAICYLVMRILRS